MKRSVGEKDHNHKGTNCCEMLQRIANSRQFSAISP